MELQKEQDDNYISSKSIKTPPHKVNTIIDFQSKFRNFNSKDKSVSSDSMTKSDYYNNNINKNVNNRNNNKIKDESKNRGTTSRSLNDPMQKKHSSLSANSILGKNKPHRQESAAQSALFVNKNSAYTASREYKNNKKQNRVNLVNTINKGAEILLNNDIVKFESSINKINETDNEDDEDDKLPAWASESTKNVKSNVVNEEETGLLKKQRKLFPPIYRIEEDFKNQLQNIYRIYNPDKLSSIDKIMIAFKGNEASLLETIAAKYDIPYNLKMTTNENKQMNNSEIDDDDDEDDGDNGKYINTRTIINNKSRLFQTEKGALLTQTHVPSLFTNIDDFMNLLFNEGLKVILKKGKIQLLKVDKRGKLYLFNKSHKNLISYLGRSGQDRWPLVRLKEVITNSKTHQLTLCFSGPNKLSNSKVTDLIFHLQDVQNFDYVSNSFKDISLHVSAIADAESFANRWAPERKGSVTPNTSGYNTPTNNTPLSSSPNTPR
jgi:hypothetical protein